MDEIYNEKLVGIYLGNIVGDVSLVSGRANKALYTNGIDQWVNIGNHRDKCLGNLRLCSKGFVMALWLKAHQDDSAGGNTEFYIDSGGHTEWSIGMTLLQQSGDLAALFRNESMYWRADVTGFESQVWYHVVLAWTGERGMQVYLDGCLHQADEGSNLANNQNPSYNDFVFGNANTALNGGSVAGEMTLDEVRVWDADMDGEDVWEIYVVDIQDWHTFSIQTKDFSYIYMIYIYNIYI